MAERVGFEPTVRKRTTVFETAPFDRSGTSPNTSTHLKMGTGLLYEHYPNFTPVTSFLVSYRIQKQ